MQFLCCGNRVTPTKLHTGGCCAPMGKINKQGLQLSQDTAVTVMAAVGSQKPELMLKVLIV